MSLLSALEAPDRPSFPNVPFKPPMTAGTDPTAVLAAASREFGLLVDHDGAITWLDDRARALGLAESLLRHVVPGCEAKALALCTQGSADSVSHWELPLVIRGKPTTCSFTARPFEGKAALLGNLLAQDYADAVAAGDSTMHEILELNRQLARGKQRLEESNKAVRALHDELAQQADRLRTSAEVKSRLVAGVSHEFRTPLHSILGLSRLLLANSDGPLTSEQTTQVRFIHDSAEELARMINDMLDLSKLDAGTTPLRTEVFELADFLDAMRGTMMPLVPEGAGVRLDVEKPPHVVLDTDRAKLAQIVRNLVSNALKFTEHGDVRVRSTVEVDAVRIAVTDTGIGIAIADQTKIFEEFTQIDSALQRRLLGTGLGLPLAKRLAESLGGRIELESVPGKGSTFSVVIPREHADIAKFKQIEDAALTPDPSRAPVLVVEDDRSTVFLYERYLSMAGFQVLPVRSTADARIALKRSRPSAVLLDVMLEGEDTWNFLAELKQNPDTRDIPVLVCTVMNRESKARALGADEFWLKPVDEDRLIRKLQTLAAGKPAKVLCIDDDPAARYLVRKFLANTPYLLLEAGDGDSGVNLAVAEKPDVILLDFLLDNITAFDVIDQLKAHPETRAIPVIIVTSQVLDLEDRQRLSSHADAILSKEHLTRELAINRIRDALRGAGIKERSPRERG